MSGGCTISDLHALQLRLSYICYPASTTLASSLYPFLVTSSWVIDLITFPIHFQPLTTMAKGVSAEVSSANRTEPGSYPLAFAQLPSPQKLHDVNPKLVVLQWVEAFNDIVESVDRDALSSLFLTNSYWRDQLCLSWDLRTIHGVDNIISVIQNAEGFHIKSIALDDTSQVRSPQINALDRHGLIEVVGSFLKIDTTKGTGVGHVRLVREDDKWKAFTLFTSLQELHGHPEKSGLSRPHGVKDGFRDQDRNWLEQRREDCKLANLTVDDRLPVLIIGTSVDRPGKSFAHKSRCWSSWIDGCRSAENAQRQSFDNRYCQTRR